MRTTNALKKSLNVNQQTKNKLLKYMSGIEKHPVFKNSYFKFLEKNKFNNELYALHRANFFFRTEATVKGIAHICAHAAANDDQDTLILYSHILNEECGDGEKSHCHELLMEQSHNIFGQAEYNLAPLKVKKAKTSKLNAKDANSPHLIIDETKAYRDKIGALLGRSYPTMLGVAYALETHASFMLTHFRNAFSLNRTNLDYDEYKRKVEIYFNCHLDSGVEDRHASDAQQCVLNNCKSDQALADIMYGIQETLQIQKDMWEGMYKKALQLTNKN